ncbi:hypothetical protein LCGC14_2973060 [marine sediment metagenome]|uniref:Uncharacterized protein n=1 Tax=marine sediment metagenome TaxID=412755 RepID=A0A0F8ZGH7_9ZZZZ
MFSIDQNCHSLWDVGPKLRALARTGREVRHFVEDVDAAFTALGSSPGQSPLRIALERFHHSGGADWGAALFYTGFLGRLPVDLRDWEPLLGMKLAAAARKLGRTVEDLYDEFSPSDNWQLIGPSYVGGRDHHRIVGDLSVREVRPFLTEIFARARTDMAKRFPDPASQQRLDGWFDRQQGLLEKLLAAHADGTLVELYRDWLAGALGGSVGLGMTSELFSLDAPPGRWAMLELFLKDYDQAAGLYNQTVSAPGSKFRPLKTGQGELPFFAIPTHQPHLLTLPRSW